MRTLVNMEIIELIYKHIRNTLNKTPCNFNMRLDLGCDDFECIPEGYVLKSEKVVNFLNIQLADGALVSFTNKDIETIISDEYLGKPTKLKILFPSTLQMYMITTLGGAYDNIPVRLIAEIENEDEVCLSKEDIKALIDVALMLKDKKWFKELTQKLKEEDLVKV